MVGKGEVRAVEDREFRIYTSSLGDEPVVQDIIGEAALDRALAYVLEQYPNDTVSVHEVFESTIEVITKEGRHTVGK